MSKAKWTKTNLAKLSLWVLVTVVACLFLLPVLWMLLTSITPNSVVMSYPPRWVPENPTLRNYVDVFTTTATARVGRALLNSAIVSLSTVLLSLVVSSLAAYPLARMEFRGRRFLLLLILVGLMVPIQVTFISLFLIAYSVGWLNSYQVLILPAAISPFGVFLLRQFFVTIPGELEDSALMDGCGRLRILYSIILPLSVPAVASLSIFIFLGSWNSFLWPLIAISNPQMMTVPVILSYYFNTLTGLREWASLMAVSAVAGVPTIVVFLVFQRYFVQGIATTGLKG